MTVQTHEPALSSFFYISTKIKKLAHAELSGKMWKMYTSSMITNTISVTLTQITHMDSIGLDQDLLVTIDISGHESLCKKKIAENAIVLVLIQEK